MNNHSASKVIEVQTEEVNLEANDTHLARGWKCSTRTPGTAWPLELAYSVQSAK